MAIYSGFSHQKWWFSIAMLNYQRVGQFWKTGSAYRIMSGHLPGAQMDRARGLGIGVQPGSEKNAFSPHRICDFPGDLWDLGLKLRCKTLGLSLLVLYHCITFSNMSGWWFQPTPLKNMSSSVGMIIPNIWKKQMFQTTNQIPIRCVWSKSTIAIHCCRVCARYTGWFFWIRSISLQYYRNLSELLHTRHVIVDSNCKQNILAPKIYWTSVCCWYRLIRWFRPILKVSRCNSIIPKQAEDMNITHTVQNNKPVQQLLAFPSPNEQCSKPSGFPLWVIIIPHKLGMFIIHKTYKTTCYNQSTIISHIISPSFAKT